MVGEACLPSNAYYPRTPDYTLCSGVHVCWSEHSDSSFVYGFMILDYGFGTMTATTLIPVLSPGSYHKYKHYNSISGDWDIPVTKFLIKALMTLVGQLSLSVGWENSPGRGQDCFI